MHTESRAALIRRASRALKWALKSLRSQPRITDGVQSSPMWLRTQWPVLVLPLLGSKLLWDVMALRNAKAVNREKDGDALEGTLRESTRDRTVDGLCALHKLLLRVAPILTRHCEESCSAKLRAELEQLCSPAAAASIAALGGGDAEAEAEAEVPPPPKSDAVADDVEEEGGGSYGDGDGSDGDGAEEEKEAEDEGDVDFYLRWASALEKCKKAGAAFISIARAEPADDPIAEEPLRERFRIFHTVAVGCRAALATKALSLALARHTLALVAIDALPAEDATRGEQTTAASNTLREVWETKHVVGIFDLINPVKVPGGLKNVPHRHTRRWEDSFLMDRAASLVLPKTRPELRGVVLPDIERAWIVRSSEACAILGSERKRKLRKLIQFLGEIVGTHRQRALILLSWILAGCESWLHAIKWDCTGALFDAVAEAVSRGAKERGSTFRSAFKDALISVVVSEVLVSLVTDMRKKVEQMWQEWTRLSLVDRVTHSVLSQDLVAVTGENEHFAEKSMGLLLSLQDAEQWQWGIGDLFNMPQQLITDTVKVWSTARLLFRKNKLLTLLMLLIYPIQNRAEDGLRSLSDRLAEWCQTQPKVDSGEVIYGTDYSLDSQLEDFESMRCHAQEPHLLIKLKQQQLKKQHLQTLEDIMPSIFDPFFSITSLVPNIICLWVGGRFVLQRTLAAGDLARFAGEALNLQKGATTLWMQLKTLWRLDNRSFGSGFALMDILEKKPTMGLDGGWQPSQKKARGETGDDDDDDSGEIVGNIEFRDVAFHYPGMKKSMLKNVSFKVKAGSFVGICGERGAGKTTLFKLIMRLYDVDSGAVLVDGRDVREYNPPWLRSQLGLSKQSPKVIDYGSLRENIVFGAEDQLRRQLGTRAAVDERIQEVLKAANIWEHFDDADKFPQGLDTPVYSWSLTGGETRSVGTARALLKDCKVMLLDEPTEGLDARNEKVIVDSLILKRRRECTILCIAHRLSTIQRADSIIMMGSDGSVVAQGTYQHLLASCPSFAEFVEAQRLEGASEGAEGESAGDAVGAAAGEAVEGGGGGEGEGKEEPIVRLVRDLASRCAAAPREGSDLPPDLISSLERDCRQLLRHESRARKQHASAVRRRKKSSAPSTPMRSYSAVASSMGEEDDGFQSFQAIPLVRTISAPSGRRSPPWGGGGDARSDEAV